VREAAAGRDYGLVVNARVDVFLADPGGRKQRELVDEAVTRARLYRAAGVDCVFPIFLSEPDAIASFVEAVQAPVNILGVPQAPTVAQLAELGVARVSYGSLLHRRLMEELGALLAGLGP
jgi:2-methylisocitrate lyase-like PEP mutase family enzyme